MTRNIAHRALVDRLLSEMIPFRFLRPTTRRGLAQRMGVEAFDEGVWILREGDIDDRCVYLVAEGTLDVVHEATGELETSIGRGRYFGERAALFGTPRARGIKTTSRVTLATLEYETFLEYLHSSPALAHALGNLLRERQGLFRAFDAFMATLLVGISNETVNVRALRQHYLELEPALHPKARDPHAIDFDALSYALPRLPEGVMSVFMFYLTDTLDARYILPLTQFRPVETAARRRSVYEMAQGKYMVMLRDGVSDLVDFVTCLCALATEAQK
ncbi:MAG: cyclic nucleotide-binding domain-containing protein, partial [Myxococcota bacterium]